MESLMFNHLSRVGSRSLPRLLLLAFCVELLFIWGVHDGFTLTSADDATRLLIADSFGRYGMWPIHWTWPPLPMFIDGLLIPDGGDLLPRAVALRAVMMAGTAFLLARFWALAFRRSSSLPGSAACVAALWLFFPINIRLALSGLSEPYLYLLLAIGVSCWQRAEQIGVRGEPGVLPWQCGAALAFGLSTWCRYEGALLAVMFAVRLMLQVIARIRAAQADYERRVPLTRFLVDLSPALIMLLFPLGWLGLQANEFGDPLTFLKSTRAAIHEEALAVYGTDMMPLWSVLGALRSHMWTGPVAVAAALGCIRLAIERRAILGAILAFVGLYCGMALVSFGGRTEFYLNLFSLVILPLAVKGLEWALWRVIRWRRGAVEPSRELTLRNAAAVALAALVILQISAVDLHRTLKGPFGDWLSPSHRDLFVRLRHDLPAGERALVMLDPSGLDTVYRFDNVALQLAAPDRVVVVPFGYLLAPRRLSRLRWLLPAELQGQLQDNPEAVSRVLASGGFTRLYRDNVGSLGKADTALARAGFLPLDEGTRGSEQVVEYVHVRQSVR